jgi:hypothetical protein
LRAAPLFANAYKANCLNRNGIIKQQKTLIYHTWQLISINAVTLFHY